MKRCVLTLVLISVLPIYSFAQISAGGTPVSFSLNVVDARMDRIPVVTMPMVDIQALHEEDAKIMARGMEDAPKPFRFGYAISVSIDIKRDGRRTDLPNGSRLWMMKIHSADAYSINLIFDQFRLSEGSKFFIYNEDKTMVLGAFTPETSNNPHNVFATDLLQGNTIVLEYYEPKYSDDGVINISKVIHGYIDTFSSEFCWSARCNIDVNCELGNNWRNQQRAIVLILVNDNTSLCTGCLMNNARQDLTPYILTARHCYFANNGWFQTVNPATNIFRFRFYSGISSNLSFSTTGADLLAQLISTDFALLRLWSQPPAYWGLYYAGWDRATTPAQNTTALHHPMGDRMKISHDRSSATAVSWGGAVRQNHWRVTFDEGIVQFGSSGSPLFNQYGRVVGQLQGNQQNRCQREDNDCFCRQTPRAEYGRFDVSWIGAGDADEHRMRLSNWLDPDNTNIGFLNGCASGLTHQAVRASREVIGCQDLIVQNITVSNGATLTLRAIGDINVENVTVTSNSGLIIYAGGRVRLGDGFRAESGSTLSIR